MTVVIRFECDAPRCRSHVAVDVLHRAMPGQLYDLSAHTETAGRKGMNGDGTSSVIATPRGVADGVVSVEAQFRLAGWYAGAQASWGEGKARLYCEAHGAVCPRCRGTNFVLVDELAVDQRMVDLARPTRKRSVLCPECEGFGVILAEVSAEALRNRIAKATGIPVEYLPPIDDGEASG